MTFWGAICCLCIGRFTKLSSTVALNSLNELTSSPCISLTVLDYHDIFRKSCTFRIFIG